MSYYAGVKFPSLPNRPGRAFTLLELLAVIVILGILAALIGAFLPKLLQRAAEAKSVSNLRNVTSALISFASDNGGGLPFEITWAYVWGQDARSLAKYLGTERTAPTAPSPLIPSVVTCPVMHKRWPSNSGWGQTFAPNAYATRFYRNNAGGTSFAASNQLERGSDYPRLMQNIPKPSSMVAFGNVIPAGPDGRESHYYKPSFNQFDYRTWSSTQAQRFVFAGGTQPFSFMDGHIEFLTPAEVNERSQGINQEKVNDFWRGGYRP